MSTKRNLLPFLTIAWSLWGPTSSPAWAQPQPMLHACSPVTWNATHDTCREVYENELAGDDSAVLTHCVRFADGDVSECVRWRVLVILIDNTGGEDEEDDEETIPSFSAVANGIGAMTNFYQDNSYGKLTLRFTVAGDAPGPRPDHTEIIGESGPFLIGDWVTRAGEKSQLPHCPTLRHLDNDGVDLYQFHKFVWLYTKNVDGGALGNGKHELAVNCPPPPATPVIDLGVKGMVRSKEWRSERAPFPNHVDLTNHELGHAMGEDHANSISSRHGREVQYGDQSDTMGAEKGHFKAEIKIGQGWLDEATYVAKPSALVGDEDWFTLKLDGLENPNVQTTPDKKALKIGLDPSLGTDDPSQPGHLWVEARRSLPGYRWAPKDTWNLHDGVVIRKQLDGERHSTTVDASPETGQDSLDDGVLMPGRTYSEGPIHITVTDGVVRATDGWAEIEVYRAGPDAPPNRAPTARLTAKRCDRPGGPDLCASVPHNESLEWPGGTWEFDASASSDPDGDPLVYFWNFEVGNNFYGVASSGYGDVYKEGDYADGELVVHTFEDNSNPRRVWLTVSDMKGGTDTAYVDQSGYSPAAPEVLSLSGVRTKGETYRFEGTGIDPNADMLTARYRLPDGSEVYGNYVLYTFPSTRSGVVTLRLDDGTAASSRVYRQHLERSWDGPIGCSEDSGEDGRRQETPSPRKNASMAVDDSASMAVLFGGIDGRRRNNETWIWTPAAGCWQEADNHGDFVPGPRSAAMMAFDDANDEFVLFGGDEGANLSDETYTMTIEGSRSEGYEARWQLRQVPSPTPSARESAALVPTGTGRGLLMFGGVTDKAPDPVVSDQAWIWDGRQWTAAGIEPEPAEWPSARARHVMAYDAVNDNVVLFGGMESGGVLSHETWIWEPQTASWSDTGAAGPAARKNAMFAFDPRVERTVLYGGEDAGGLRSDVWEWDGTRWLDWSMRQGALIRKSASMAFVPGDKDPDALLVFGGQLPPRAGRPTGVVNTTFKLRTDLPPAE